MKRRLTLLLLVPALAVVALAVLIVGERTRDHQEAIVAAEIAALGRSLAELDSALGNEAVAGAFLSTGTPMTGSSVAYRPGVTDSRLQGLERRLRTSAYSYHPDLTDAAATVRQTLDYRSDFVSRTMSPLQIADRYGHIRHLLLDAFAAQIDAAGLSSGSGPLGSLASVIRARSAHLDERLAVELAIRYDSWAPGQHGLAVASQALQDELLNQAATRIDIGSTRVAITGLDQTAHQIRLTDDVPDLSREEWLAISDQWMALLDADVEAGAVEILSRFRETESIADQQRRITIAAVIVLLSVVAYAAMLFAMRLVQRVVAVTERAQLLAKDPAATVPEISSGESDELGLLATAFDDMAMHLRRSAVLQRIESNALDAILRGDSLTKVFAAIAPLLGTDSSGNGLFRFSHHCPSPEREPFCESPSGTTIWIEPLGDDNAIDAPSPDALETRRARGLAATAQARFDDDQRIRFQLRNDRLTRLQNRGAILESAAKALGRSSAGAIGLAYVDLDGFKEINDTYGHGAGDTVLVAQASRLGAVASRHGGSAGRLGGDEFLVVLPKVATDDGLAAFAEEVLAGLDAPVEIDGGIAVTATVSIGCVVADQSRVADDWIHQADFALYEAKREGRNRAIVSTVALRTEALDAEMLREEVRGAVANGEFTAHFQPIWKHEGHWKLAGFEALARWYHPDRGLVSPGVFLPVIENLNLASEFDAAVFTLVCEQIAAWTRAGLAVPYMSINVSAARLEQPTFVEESLAAMHDAGVDPTSIIIEVTEEGVMTDVAGNSERLDALRREGVRVAADDFGKGYSSLAYLHQLPVDIVKIDRQFVDHIDGTRSNRAIVSAILALAAELELTLVAEGVERSEEIDELLRLGCRRVQGFLLGRPAPIAETEVLLAMNSPERDAESNQWFDADFKLRELSDRTAGTVGAQPVSTMRGEQ